MAKRLRWFFALSVLLISTLSLTLPNKAHAMLLCRSDPVVVLSNGMTLDLSAIISTLPSQVTEVHYELHVPVGVSLVAAVQTPTWLTSQETFTLYADQPSRQYETVTTVHTTVGNASVTAETSLVSPLGLVLADHQVSGGEGEALSISFSS